MKVKENIMAKALDAPDGKIRFYLVYGPDDSGSRALAARLDRAMGAGAERIDLDGATLKDDPARLPDEAAAISLFGDRRYVRVTGGEECLAAVEALLESPITGDPVIMVAGALKPASALLKRVLNAPNVLVCQLYRLDPAQTHELAIALGRTHGVRLTRAAAHALAADCQGDRAIIEREIEKIALYLDAAPDRPRDGDTDTLEAIGAGLDETDVSALVDAVMDGRLPAVAAELAVLADSTSGPIPVLRALSRRIILLTRLRAHVDAGHSVGHTMATAGKTVFFKERDTVAGQVARWRSSRLQTAANRVFSVEAAIKKANTAGDVLAHAELITLTHPTGRLR
jgi:DNA polymerase III subunit delta